jgi:hypothetical protein
MSSYECPRCSNSKLSSQFMCDDCWTNLQGAHEDKVLPAVAASAAVEATVQKKSLLDGMSSDERKKYPLVTGCLDYFRDALLYVSNVSLIGNRKHNPGAMLHWDRSKSTDELDALGRHLLCREDMDMIDAAYPDELVEEAAEMAWRALAYLQKLLEAKYNIKPPPGCQ